MLTLWTMNTRQTTQIIYQDRYPSQLDHVCLFPRYTKSCFKVTVYHILVMFISKLIEGYFIVEPAGL